MFLLERFRRRIRSRLRAVQVEVTSRCTRRCVVCPRSSLGDEWQEGDMEGALWRILVRDLGLVRHVHLQGWGEPLLHPSLSDWARDAQQAGCTVGLTTNGDLLNEASEWLLRGDVDQVVVSLAGDFHSHSTLRDGSCLDAVLEASSTLSQRAKKRRLRLRVLGSYLLTRENAAALPIVVQKVARSGLDEMYVVHLDCRTSEYQFRQSAFEEEDLCEGIAPYLEEAERMACELGLDYRGPARQAEELLACALDPAQFVFIAWDGRVSPCVNLLLPGVESIPRWTEQGPIQVVPVWYGRLGESNLADLLGSAAYHRFIAPFQARRNAERKFLASLLNGFWGVRRQLDAADNSRSSALTQNPFPVGCSACPKENGW